MKKKLKQFCFFLWDIEKISLVTPTAPTDPPTSTSRQSSASENLYSGENTLSLVQFIENSDSESEIKDLEEEEDNFQKT